MTNPRAPTAEELKARRERFRKVELTHGCVEIRLALLAADAGGRKTPICSDYRPNWNLGDTTADGRAAFSDGVVILEDRDWLAPGETAVVHVFPLTPASWRRLEPGDEIDCCEGHKKVGSGTVLSVTLRPDPA